MKTFKRFPGGGTTTIAAATLAFLVGCGDPDAGKYYPISERQRMTELSLKTANTLEGAALVNNKIKIPKGVLLAYEVLRLDSPSTFCEISGDGTFRMENVPRDEVVLVLRTDVEAPAVGSVVGIPSKKQQKKGFSHYAAAPMSRQPPSGRNNDHAPTKTFIRSYTDSPEFYDLPEDDRWLLEAAFAKFGNQESADAYRLKIRPGANVQNINFQVREESKEGKLR